MTAPGASDRRRRRLAWAVPVVVAGAVAVGVTVTTAAASTAPPKLAPRTAAQLLVAVQQSNATALSGDVRETANLGLPSLPGGRSSASLSWQTFVTGSHSARVWADGPDKQRVALLGELSEADAVHNGSDVWTYTSDTNEVTHTVLKHGAENRSEPSATDMTPAAVAAHVLKAVAPSTAVTVDTSRTVAKRPAYTLVLRPRDVRSTVRKVSIAIDAHKFIPLQVQIFGAGSSAAFEIGFRSISFSTPPASTFRFHAPAGAIRSSNPLQSHGDRHEAQRPEHHTASSAAPGSHRSGSAKVIGSGWTSVLELPSGSTAGLGGILDEATSAVGSSGERLLHTALVNAVLMPDGRTFVGAVEPSLLEHIAATTPR